MAHQRTIVIVGGGFSGTALAIALVRQTAAPTRIVVVERGAAFGLGQAYATTEAAHLLNVPAGRMSAFADQPDDFTAWLNDARAEAFQPRRRYGAYLRARLDQAVCQAGGRLALVQGQVVHLAAGPPHRLGLADGRSIAADAVVLALGNFPPLGVLPPAALASAAYRGNPWAPDAVAGLAHDDPVLLVGTGLTMVDTVLSLQQAGHCGPIHALSRRGLQPRRHGAAVQAAALPPDPVYPATALGLLRVIRADVAACGAAGAGWQAAFDRVRPHIQPAWMAAAPAERSRFLRHLRPWWDVHRHRIAPAVAHAVDAAIASGQLTITAGRLIGAEPIALGLRVHYAPRRGGAPACFDVARVINCTGPAVDYRRIDDPLVRHLLTAGLAVPGPLGLGLATHGNALVDSAGLASATLFALGAVTRGVFWEITAVPDIRVHCATLARHLADLGADPQPGYSSGGPIDRIRSNTRLRMDGSVMR